MSATSRQPAPPNNQAADRRTAQAQVDPWYARSAVANCALDEATAAVAYALASPVGARHPDLPRLRSRVSLCEASVRRIESEKPVERPKWDDKRRAK